MRQHALPRIAVLSLLYAAATVGGCSTSDSQRAVDGAPPRPDAAQAADGRETPEAGASADLAAADRALADLASGDGGPGDGPREMGTRDTAAPLDSGVDTVDPCAGVTPVAGRPPLTATLVAQTSAASLVDLAFAPGDASGRVFAAARLGGQVLVIDGGKQLAQPYLDLGGQLSAGGERGLLSIAFHPGYAVNRRSYVFFTDLAGDVRVVEYQTLAADPNRADPASARLILVVPQPESNHNGGALRFGPDGYLYISLGDGGGGGDAHGTIGNGQSLDTLLGKLLRIDVDQQPGGAAYGIPPGNPFVGDPQARPEIYHLGLRNPFRFSFDATSGAMWIADVGQSTLEELDHAAAGQAGLNFGWRCREGDLPYKHTPNCDNQTFTEPVLVQAAADGFCSIIVGYPYRGCRMPGYHGTVFYGDYCQDGAYSFEFAGGVVSGEAVHPGVQGGAVGWAEDHQGELYFVSEGSDIYRLDPQP